MVYQMGSDNLWHWRLISWTSAASAVALGSDAVPEFSALSAYATSAQGAKADTALQNAAAFDAFGAAASAQSAAVSTASSDATAKANAAQAFAIQRANQTGTQAANTITGLGTQMATDTGWTANNTDGDKTAALSSYTNGLNATIITALNLAAANSGTALGAALDVLVIVVKKLAALETALVAGKLPNA